MDEGIGPLLIPVLVVLVVAACIVVVMVLMTFAVFVALGAAGVLALSNRAGGAKRLAGEVDTEDVW